MGRSDNQPGPYGVKPALGAYHYGWSVVSCLPGAMGDPETAATGAVMRTATLRRYATEATFRAVDVLPIHTSTWALLPARPATR